MKIIIGSDHRGYKLKEGLKEYLNRIGIEVKDCGCFSEDSVDYPDIGKEVAKLVAGSSAMGILICGSGIGMSITANRFSGVRAALCRDESDAELSRMHNNSNILVLGADFTDEKNATKIIDRWINTGFEGGRHERRINKIDEISKGIEVGASLLSKPEDMSTDSLVTYIKGLEEAGIDSIHFDVMDGRYNDNNTWAYQGPSAIKRLRGVTALPFTAHLMISNPMDSIHSFNDAGCNTIIFHYEAGNAEVTAERIKSFGRRAGIAIEPETPVEKIAELLPYLDEVLVMTVRTGYAGQGFMDMTDKIKALDKIRKEKGMKFRIAVDGGINNETGKRCREAGADILAAASYIRKNDHKAAINCLRGQ